MEKENSRIKYVTRHSVDGFVAIELGREIKPLDEPLPPNVTYEELQAAIYKAKSA